MLFIRRRHIAVYCGTPKVANGAITKGSVPYTLNLTCQKGYHVVGDAIGFCTPTGLRRPIGDCKGMIYCNTCYQASALALNNNKNMNFFQLIID